MWFPTAAASLIVEHGLNSCGAHAFLLHGMRNLPGPGTGGLRRASSRPRHGLKSCLISGLFVLAGFGYKDGLLIFSESNAPLGMVACSKAFLETETSEIDEILSLKNVFIQIVNGKCCRHLPSNGCRLSSVRPQ